MKRLAMFCLGLGLATAAQAWLRPEYEDATIVERSELIVVGHLELKSIEYVPHEGKPDEGRSWEHHANLVIREVLKGKCETSVIPIIIHYGLTPIVGGYVNRDGFMMDNRGGRKDYPTNRVEIMDTGNSAHGYVPLVEDAATDNLWFLRRRSGIYGREPGTGNFGIVDPEDLQPLKLKDYFLCHLSSHPQEDVVKYAAKHPDVADRVPLTQYAKTVLAALNQKAADPAWQSRIDMVERPETRPANLVDSGEVTAFLSESKQRLANVGTRVNWNATSKRYELAPEEQTQVSGQPAPLSYRDPISGVILVVENNRHRVLAVDVDGEVLWSRQPASDGKLPPYSQSNPKSNPAIVWIGALTEGQSAGISTAGSGRFVGISFNSRQAGALDLKTGDFTFQGQD